MLYQEPNSKLRSDQNKDRQIRNPYRSSYSAQILFLDLQKLQFPLSDSLDTL